MITTDQFFSFPNFVAKMFADDSKTMLADHYAELYQQIEEAGLTTTNRYVFTILNMFRDELPIYEVGVPVVEDAANFTDTSVSFRSVFFQKDLLLTRITTDFDRQAVLAYTNLKKFAEESGYQIVTPFFNVMTLRDDGTPWYLDVSCRAKTQMEHTQKNRF